LATRIFELAKELGVTSKTILTKCRAEGLDVKNHMSTISVGLGATIREWFTEQTESHSAVEVTEHVGLEIARKQARKSRRHGAVEGGEPGEGEAPQAGEEAAAAAAVGEPVVAPSPAEPVEAPAEPVELAPAAEATETVEVVQTAVAVVEPPEAQEQAPAIVEPAAAEVAAEVTVAAEAQAPQAEELAQAPQAEAQAPPAEEPPAPLPGRRRPREDIKPAGPQVVPRPPKLTGPRQRVRSSDLLGLDWRGENDHTFCNI
jgi:translation initiation factor IF-2